MRLSTLPKPARNLLATGLALSAFAFALCGCEFGQGSSGPGPMVLSLTLHDSVSRYDSVSIVVTGADDTTSVLEDILQGPLRTPSEIPTHTMTRAKDPFLVKVRGYRKLKAVAGSEQLALSTNIWYERGRKRVEYQAVPPQAPFNWLETLSTAPGGLQPPFNSDVLDYRLPVAAGVTSVSFYLGPVYPKAILQVDGEPARQGDATFVFPVGTSDTTVSFTVSDIGVVRTYQVRIVHSKPLAVKLDSIWFSRGALAPAFDSETSEFTLTIPATASSVDLKFWPADPANVQLFFRNAGIIAGAAQTVTLASPGATTTTTVVVQKGANRREYTLRIERLR